MITRLILFLALTASATAADYYPPDARFGVYGANVYQGIVGGIPTRSGGTQIYVADHGWSESNTAAQNTTAFNNARALATSGSVIHLPAGTFACNGLQIGFQTTSQNNITIRGAGSGAGGTTLVIPSGRRGIQLGENADWGNTYNLSANVTALARNSNQITVDNPSLFAGYTQMYKITFTDEVATPILRTNTRANTNRSIVVVGTSQAGSTLTLAQPLPSSFASAVAAGVVDIEAARQQNWLVRGIGVEDINFDCTAHVISTDSQSNTVYYAHGCWFKGVKITSYGNYALLTVSATNLEIRGSTLVGNTSGATSQGGLHMTDTANALIEDNIIGGTPSQYAWLNFVNNVVAYNYFIGTVNANHNLWASHNLYEGNRWAGFMPDGFYGGASEDTLFRNWSRYDTVAALKRGTRNYNLIGNLAGVIGVTTGTDGTAKWGNPNIGNENSSGTVSPSTGTWWADWDSAAGRERRWEVQLTERTTNTTGVVTILDPAEGDSLEASLVAASYTRKRNIFGMQFVYFGTRSGNTWPVSSSSSIDGNTGGNLSALNTITNAIAGPGGFQEKDQDVYNTAILKANWYVVHGNAIRPGEELDVGETLPISYFRTSKPTYFGNKNWPPYDYASPSTFDGTEIPAGHRYINGNEDYLGPSAPTFSTHPTTQTATIGDTVTLTVAGGGSPAPTLQWRKGEVNISGATSSSLVLTNVQFSDAGSYDCVATNDEGTATSNAATLTVNAAPSEGGTATIQTLNVGTLNIP